MAAGVEVAVITGRRSQVVAERMASLGVAHVHQGHDDKRPVFDGIVRELGLDATRAAYVGDDLVDLPVMRACGLAVAVADADARVLAAAHWCTPAEAGAAPCARSASSFSLPGARWTRRWRPGWRIRERLCCSGSAPCW